MNKKFMLLLTFGLWSVSDVSAQEVDMATGFRSEGKIYVVVAVIMIILIGLFVYLFRLDKKLKKLEEE